MQGGQLLVATYDRDFARAAVAAGREHTAIEHRSVHPVNPSRGTLKTASAVEELDRKRNAYLRDQDSEPLAQDYANEVRIFLEARRSEERRGGKEWVGRCSSWWVTIPAKKKRQ